MKRLIFFFLIVIMLSSCTSRGKDRLIYVAKNSDKGFEFPYYLFIPEGASDIGERILIVEPNNTGTVSDSFAKHKDKARRTAERDYYMGNYIARNLQFPLLVPVFPRSATNWKMYTHSLDRDVMVQKEGKLVRIDLQLLAMVEDARERLGKLKISTGEQILMTGFSASGTFVNRFTLIHPDKVRAVVAGGVNGLLMLPLSEVKGKKVNYPLGTADFRELFDKSFDPAAFKNTPQMLFMGELDDNDAIPYEDGYEIDERELVFELLGEEMMPRRWNACMDIYKELGVKARFKTYKGIGHEQPENIKEDVLLFFKEQIK